MRENAYHFVRCEMKEKNVAIKNAPLLFYVDIFRIGVITTATGWWTTKEEKSNFGECCATACVSVCGLGAVLMGGARAHGLSGAETGE